jgi:hypothetical protein
MTIIEKVTFNWPTKNYTLGTIGVNDNKYGLFQNKTENYGTLRGSSYDLKDMRQLLQHIKKTEHN